MRASRPHNCVATGDGPNGRWRQRDTGNRPRGADMRQQTIIRRSPMRAVASALVLGALIAAPTIAAADEGGVSFWLHGFLGSLAAAPLHPGWTVATTYYHTTVSASGDDVLAREHEHRRIPIGLSANRIGSINANACLRV